MWGPRLIVLIKYPFDRGHFRQYRNIQFKFRKEKGTSKSRSQVQNRKANGEDLRRRSSSSSGF